MGVDTHVPSLAEPPTEDELTGIEGGRVRHFRKEPGEHGHLVGILVHKEASYHGVVDSPRVVHHRDHVTYFIDHALRRQERGYRYC